MHLFKITYKSGAIRTMRKETEELVRSRLDWEQRLVGKSFADLEVEKKEKVNP